MLVETKLTICSVHQCAVLNQTTALPGKTKASEARKAVDMSINSSSRSGKVIPLGVLAFVLLVPPTHAERMSYLRNGSIKIGVDLDQGGTRPGART
jgi:hypothetical protein